MGKKKASLYRLRKSEDIELFRILDKAGFDAGMARAIIQEPKLAGAIVRLMHEYLGNEHGAVQDDALASDRKHLIVRA